MSNTSTLPLKRAGAKKPVNLYLNTERTPVAAACAAERYNLSLSEMVDEFLAREVDSKEGILRTKAPGRGRPRKK